MRNVVLFIAMSLDGYIAENDGSVDWLTGQEEPAEDFYGAFIKDVDAVVMGWNTYHQIITELSPENWVYSGLKSYVLTHRNAVACRSTRPVEEIVFCNEPPCALVKELKQQSGRDIWICGGAQVVQQLIAENMIDRYYISIIPTILGKGIRLFGEAEEKILLRLVKVQSSGGITALLYEKRGEAHDCN